MTVGFVLDVKVFILLVDAVRRTLLPLRLASRLGAAALILLDLFFIHSERTCGECGLLSCEV
jgi:hypothetical protein